MVIGLDLQLINSQTSLNFLRESMIRCGSWFDDRSCM